MSDLPKPLTPPDCDVRSHDWFALKFRQVRDSEFWLNASDRVRVVSFHLWGCAYEQVPAASLPDRDDRLADLSGYGMFGIAQWREIRDEVLSAWIKCSDDRWYHPTLAEVALEAWIARLRERARKRSAAGERAASQLSIAEQYLDRLLNRRGSSAEAGDASGEGCKYSAERGPPSAEKTQPSGVTGQDKTGQDSKSPNGDLFTRDEPSEAGKATDRKDCAKPTGLDPNFHPPPDWMDEACEKGRLTPEETAEEWDSFRSYWSDIRTLKKGKKRDWKRTWINYVTGDICQRRVGARRRNANAGGNDRGAPGLIERTASRYR